MSLQTGSESDFVGGNKGNCSVVHPNNHVDFLQSVIDIYPTAFRLALLLISPDLLDAVQSGTNL